MSKQNFETLKVVLIGESGVGKTSIISQFIDKVFENDPQSTIGGTFSTKKIQCGNGKLLNLEIWDTAGQERYRSVTKMFYKDANAALLIYDITNKISFEEIQKYWIVQVKESAPENIILAIVGNKLDLFENEKVDENEGRQFAQEIGALFYLTSPKKGMGIKDLFYEIGNKILNPKDGNNKINNENNEDINNISRKGTHKLNEERNKKKKNCCR